MDMVFEKALRACEMGLFLLPPVSVAVESESVPMESESTSLPGEGPDGTTTTTTPTAPIHPDK